MKINTNNIEAVDYWEERFSTDHSKRNNSIHHSEQNIYISGDFIKNMTQTIGEYLNKSNSLIEIGCGTGELSYKLSQIFKLNITGTDLSPNGIEFANSKYVNENLTYKSFDCLKENISELYDLSICSNTLEHFLNPYEMIDRILDFSKNLIILVPYNQPVTDGYSCEGGAGHVFQFTDESFNNYKVLDSFKFTTPGWQYSSKGEIPTQLCIMITKKESH
jgi:2-polyprenyl-3-methyl-5-hydroxy-6-metoxy-1,4-benzoquinol methylase